MGCTSCGTNPMMVDLLIKNAITEAIKDGTLQAGLAKCGDQIERLQKDTRVVTCDGLEKQICQLIENDDICFVKPLSISIADHVSEPDLLTLTLTLTDGTQLSTSFTKPLTRSAIKSLIKSEAEELGYVKKSEVEQIIKDTLATLAEHVDIKDTFNNDILNKNLVVLP